MTASAVSAFGLPIPARTRLTVAVETPARRATSRIVEGAERSLTPVPYEIGPHMATSDGQRRRLQATVRPLSRIPSCLREPIRGARPESEPLQAHAIDYLAYRAPLASSMRTWESTRTSAPG